MAKLINETLMVKSLVTFLLATVCAPITGFSADNAARTSSLGTKVEGKYIERGRYLVRIAGCNDCHTAGYAQSGGTVPEKKWLLGDRLGFRGPWGTTYPANLRQTMSTMSESDWIKTAQTVKLRPPMPWFALRDMNKEDVRAIYRFVRYLGPAGSPAPAFVPPNQVPTAPYVQFPAVPQ